MLENAERNIRWIETHRIPAKDLGALPMQASATNMAGTLGVIQVD